MAAPSGPANRPGHKPIGQICVDRGYTTRERVEEALRIQKGMDDRGEPHKLLGIILLERGFISSAHLIEILRMYETERAARET